MKTIIIYGTGKYGHKTYSFLEDVGCKVAFFCKTYAEKNEYFDGIKVLSLQELNEYDKENILLFIAIRDRRISSKIANEVEKIGIKNNQIININDSLRKNVMIEKVQTGGTFFCNCCNDNVMYFSSAGENGDLFSKHHIIGGGYRENVICPRCAATDRVRWQKYVLTHFTNVLSERCNVLHIAPEDHIYELIQRNAECDYYACDIELGKTQHRCDLTDIQFKDNFFDYIIANHVLEHIKRIDLAFSEIKRVLKENGKLIISFPICTDSKTKEEISNLSPQDRLEQFGQEDHVRLFGYDYKEYIEKYGFHINIMSPENVLDAATISKYGLIKDDVILICTK